MKRYNLNKLIPGYKIRPSLKGKTLVALPFQVKEPTTVIHNNENYHLQKDSPLLHQETFKDKFGRNKTYTLYYYEYTKEVITNQTKLF